MYILIPKLDFQKLKFEIFKIRKWIDTVDLELKDSKSKTFSSPVLLKIQGLQQ